MISFKIAVRFLKSGRTQTVLIVIGIAIAISVQIFVGLLISSLQKSLVNRTVGNSPQITIESSNDEVTIPRWEGVIEQIQPIGAIKAVSVAASNNAFIEEGNKTTPILVRGFQLDAADKIYNIYNSIYEGSPYKSRREALIGKELREELGMDLRDRLTVITPYGKTSTFTISGFYDVGVASINKSWIITSLRTAQSIFGFGDRITSIEISVNDVFKADAIAGEIEKKLSKSDIKIDNWKDQNQQLLSGLEGQRISSIVIQGAILASVVIAISSILAITVIQKSRQIGILKAMGIKDRAASLIFLYQGFLLGLIGSAVGVILGLGLLYLFVIFTSNSEGSSLIEIYIEYDFILRSWLIALLASTLAGVVAARKSSKLSPIDVIREG